MTKLAKKNNIFHFGIDVAKEKLDIHCLETGEDWQINNTRQGIKAFAKKHRNLLKDGYICVDTTGGYELLCCTLFYEANYKVHQAHSLHVKFFIRSLGQEAKTDRLDAIMLAHYGLERKKNLRLYKTESQAQQEIKALVIRRSQLVKMQTSEKNRSSGPMGQAVKASCEAVLEVFKEQIAVIEQQIEDCLKKDEMLSKKAKVLVEITGIADKTRNVLLALLPEIGQLDGKEVAALAGLAPYAKDSGKQSKYRSIKGGRQILKTAMVMAAQSAVRFDPKIKAFYERLLAKGKLKMVAMTAAARKMLVIANAKVRDMDLVEGGEKSAT